VKGKYQRKNSRQIQILTCGCNIYIYKDVPLGLSKREEKTMAMFRRRRFPFLTGVVIVMLFASGSMGSLLHSYPFGGPLAIAIWVINDGPGQIMADDFVIDGSNAVVESVEFWVILVYPVIQPSAFKLGFYQSDPGGIPGTLIQETEWITDFTIVDTGELEMGLPVYKVNIDLTAAQQFHASSGVRYWIGYQARSTGEVCSALGKKINGAIACIWLNAHSREWKWMSTYDAFTAGGATDVFFNLHGSLESTLENTTWGQIKNSFQ
jgi:hypothetical protein